MKTKVTIANKSASFDYTFDQLLNSVGVYRPKGSEQDRLIRYSGNTFYVGSDNRVGIANEELWKNRTFVKVPGESVTVTFTND